MKEFEFESISEEYFSNNFKFVLKPPKNNWKTKHEEFIAAIRYAKTTDRVLKEGGDIRSLPPPPASTNPDYIQCPHCGRKFNAAAGERHIPKCKTTVNKPKPPPGLRR